MSVWFEGTNDIDCDIGKVKRALDNPGEFFVGVVGLMPGLTSVELLDKGSDFVTIKTNEGVMKRTNISSRIEADSVVVESDEEYEAGSRITVTGHFSDEFTSNDTGVTYRIVMSDVTAPGLMGYFYRTFGSTKMGSAYLSAYKSYFEAKNDPPA